MSTWEYKNRYGQWVAIHEGSQELDSLFQEVEFRKAEVAPEFVPGYFKPADMTTLHWCNYEHELNDLKEDYGSYRIVRVTITVEGDA